MSRLSSTGLIDRSSPLSFKFDGRTYSGFAGDTLASALIANDVQLIGRSFKYHRPRGIMTAGSEEPNALVTLRKEAFSEPNTRATNVQLFDGLEASSQNRWPSLSFDLLAVNQILSPVLIAGFYYKTFMWPKRFWESLYEPLIRRAAGLGALSLQPDPDSYDRAHSFCDLLVVGGGAAGLTAALTAGRAGLRVVIADGDWVLGGRLLAETHEIDGLPGASWASQAANELRSMPQVTVLTRTSVFGAYDGQEYGAIEQVSDHLLETPRGRPRQRLWKIHAKRILLATGAIERPLVFGGNDRPGVMMASAVSAYVNRFAAMPGTQAVVFTSTDTGWKTAEHLLKAGARLKAVIDTRIDLPASLTAAVGRAGAEIFQGAIVTDALGKVLRTVEITTSDGAKRRISADLLAVSGGWNPSIGIGSNLGDRPAWSDEIQSFVLERAPPGLTPIGAAAGQLSLGSAVANAVKASEKVIGDLGFAFVPKAAPECSDDPMGIASLWHIGPHHTKAFVDFQNDVTDSDVKLAALEGFVSIEHMKRYTTLGMATDQGKTSQLNGHALLAAAVGKSIAETGTILSRPPYSPVAIAAFAGHNREADFRPERRTASHEWAQERGATFVDASLWKRAQWFARPGELDWLETVNREVTMTRNGVGICDVSTLGKIDVHGPDAGVLLDRLYINTFSTLKIGRARYGIMLREDGFVMDDGTTTRFSDDRFFVTTTTVNAARVMQHIDFARQVLWPELDVQATSVTEQWATFAVAGPSSRRLLETLLPDVGLSNENFPYMSAAEFAWRGMDMRLFRLSFSGELAYEISVPAFAGDQLVRALFEAGAPLNVVPYGTEALGVMRIEKGHAAGNELNGQTTAGDLGMSRMMSTKKEYIGRAMAGRKGLLDPERPSLVGIRSMSNERLRAGAHLIPLHVSASASHDEGFVTSTAFSPTLAQWIGLALLKRGTDRLGEQILVHDPVRGPDVAVEICHPVFFDAEGLRVRG
jgi:methylglutamate dehydrogenase subunit C